MEMDGWVGVVENEVWMVDGWMEKGLDEWGGGRMDDVWREELMDGWRRQEGLIEMRREEEGRRGRG